MERAVVAAENDALAPDRLQGGLRDVHLDRVVRDLHPGSDEGAGAPWGTPSVTVTVLE